MSGNEIAVSLRFEKDRLIVWMKASKRRQNRYTLYLIVLAILAMNFLFVLPTAQNKVLPAAMAAVCVGAALLVFWMAHGSKKGATKVDELYHGGEEYRVFFREDGFTYKSSGREDTIAYSEQVRVQEHEQYFAIHYRAGGIFIVPKAAMPDPQVTALSHFLSERLGKNYKYSA